MGRVVYVCGRCGLVLAVYPVTHRFRGVPTPGSIAGEYGGACPRCGGPLGRRVRVVVLPHGALAGARLGESLGVAGLVERGVVVG